jgi:signal peptidase II
VPILFLSLAVVIIDQLVKYYVQNHMTPGMSIPVIENVFHITYILNPGAAFGILKHQTAFFIGVALILFIVLIYAYPRIPQHYRMLRFGIGLQLGGAVGNVIDRIKTGYVVDFFDFRIWPIFNIADIAIVCGVGLIVYTILFPPGQKDEKDD